MRKPVNVLALCTLLASLLVIGCAEQMPLEAEETAFQTSVVEPDAAKKGGSITTTLTDVPVLEDGTQVGTFTGELKINRFVDQAGDLVAQGVLDGLITNGITEEITDQLVEFLVTVGEDSSCEILFLELGPIHLDLLGLQVDLSEVVLEITAEQGSGNLLGNLLCAVAHLLDSNAATQGLAQLLNNILAALGDITL